MLLCEGRNSLDDLDSCLKTGAKIFLVRGKSSYEKSGAKRVINQKLKGRILCEFSDFDTNPKVNDVRRGVQLLRKSTANIIVAVGGGSVIDMAKLVGIYSRQLNDPVCYATGLMPFAAPSLPIVAIPTTAGTGSEVTNFAVMYIEGKKYSICHDSLLPAHVFVDPNLCDSLPPIDTATSGLDAICQAVESLWSIKSTDASDRYAEESLKLSIASLHSAFRDGDPVSRDKMCRAATLAGKAINITKTTAPHALSYALTTEYGIPHGHAVSMFLGAFIDFNAEVTDRDCQDRRGLGHVKKKIQRIMDLFGAKSVAGTRRSFEQLISNLNLSVKLTDVGVVDLECVSKLVESVNLERLQNNPRQVKQTSLTNLLTSLL